MSLSILDISLSHEMSQRRAKTNRFEEEPLKVKGTQSDRVRRKSNYFKLYNYILADRPNMFQ